MESESKDIIVLGVIMRGVSKFDNIKKNTQIDAKELNSILEKLEVQGLITVQEKKGLLGSKIEIFTTENGRDEVDKRVHELQEKWNQMSQIYKTGDKGKLS
jgi:DNA-binding HxlR family transcriptional regulator